MKNKKIITTVATVGVVGLLTGCTGSFSTSAFEPQKMEQSPIWNTTDFDTSTWPGGSTDGTSVASFGDTAIVLQTEGKECTLIGSIDYTQSFKENRGDEYNSFELLYEQAGIDSADIVPEVESINGIDYAVGAFHTVDVTVETTNVEAVEGEAIVTEDEALAEEQTAVVPEYETIEKRQYKKVAARVFSTAQHIPGYEQSQEDISSEATVDASKGLPAVTITVSCDLESDLTDELWENGVERFKLSFEGKKVEEEATTEDTLEGQLEESELGEQTEEEITPGPEETVPGPSGVVVDDPEAVNNPTAGSEE